MKNSITKAASSGGSFVPSFDIKSLLDSWIEAERNGVQFPVPFDMAYPMAGYTRKDNAKRALPKSSQGELYLTSRIETKGRPVEQISLSIAGLEHMCLMADTPEGYEIREYFRDARDKWQLVKQINPQIASEVEILKIKQDIAKLEAQKAVAEAQSMGLRHLVVTTMPEPMQQKILGFEIVKEIEYRDRVILNNQVVDDGNTVNKTELCDRYNIKTRNGAPDFKRLNALLEGAKLPPAAWEETTTIRSNMQLRRDWLENLDSHILGTTRQLHVGE
jgi:hypothetical protein